MWKQSMQCLLISLTILSTVNGQLEFIGPTTNQTIADTQAIIIPLANKFPFEGQYLSFAYLMRNGIILFNNSEANQAYTFKPQKFPSSIFSYVLAPFWVNNASVNSVVLSYDVFSGSSPELDKVNRHIVSTGEYFKGTWMLVTRWNMMNHTNCVTAKRNVSTCNNSTSNNSTSEDGSGSGFGNWTGSSNVTNSKSINCTGSANNGTNSTVTTCSTSENTFQAVLITNGKESYAVYIYRCGLLQWSTGDNNTGYAIVGYGTPNGGPLYNHPLSGSSSIGKIACDNGMQWNAVVYRIATAPQIKGYDFLPFLPLTSANGVLTTFLWPGDDGTSGPIYINNGFPFGAAIHRVAYVGINGILSFRQPWYAWYPQPFPTYWYWWRNNYIVAPFWNDHQTDRSGYVYYQVHEHGGTEGGNVASNNLLAGVSSFITRQRGGKIFSGRWMTVVQWDAVHPYPHGYYWWYTWWYSYYYNYYYNDNYYSPWFKTIEKTNTYQAIVITDGVESYAVFTYQCGSLQWGSNTWWPFSTIGYNAAGLFYENHPFTGQPFVSDIACINMKKSNIEWSNVVYKLSLDDDAKQQIRAKCVKQYNTDVQLFPSAPDVTNVSPCPCSVWQLWWNWGFWYYEYTGRSICYVRWSAPGNTWSCCYSWEYPTWGALLLSGDEEGSSLLLFNPYWNYEAYKTYDRDFKDLCCGIGLCKLYYERRPPATCNGYVQPFWGWMWGDPHLTTLDGKEYTFNGWGEYTLLVLNDGSFTFQGRMMAVGSANGTQFSAFALGKRGSTVEVMTSNGQQLVVFHNGTNITNQLVQNNNFSYDDVLVLKNGSNSYVVSFSSGVGAIFNIAAGLPNFVLSLPASFRGNTSGLLGNFNGNQSDDFMFPNKTVLRSPQSDRMIHMFGQSWQVAMADRLFTAATGTPLPDPGHTPLFADELNTTGWNTAVCGGNPSCVYDYIATGNQAVGVASMTVSSAIAQGITLARNFPPVLIGSDVYVVTAATASVYNFTVTDDDTGVSVGIVGGTPARSSLTHTGSAYMFAWTPASPGDVNGVTFYATDSLGASGILRPTTYLCPCLNGGTCANDGIFNSTRNITVMYCNCPPAWEGDLCDTDADGCVSLFCGVGSTCYDLPAPSVGAECSCSQGYVYDATQQRCQDINECQDLNPCPQLCLNSPGSYQCACSSGYEAKEGACVDVDECATGLAGCHQLCVNEVGSYHCGCFAGFVLNGDNTTCSANSSSQCPVNNPCSPNLCAMVMGVMTCQCAYGYVLDNSTHLCVDYNECSKHGACAQNCTNLNGSFACSCLPGYALQSDGRSCEDVDECSVNSRLIFLGYADNLCPASKMCTNLVGSYKCVCPLGTVEPNCSVIQDTLPPPRSSPRPPNSTELSNSYNMTLCGFSAATFNDTTKVNLRAAIASAVVQHCNSNPHHPCNTTSGGPNVAQVDATGVHISVVASTTGSNGTACLVLQTYVTSPSSGTLDATALSSAVQAGGSIYKTMGFNILEASSPATTTTAPMATSILPTVTNIPPMATNIPPTSAPAVSVVGLAVGIALGMCVVLVIAIGTAVGVSYIMKPKVMKAKVEPLKSDEGSFPLKQFQDGENTGL